MYLKIKSHIKVVTLSQGYCFESQDFFQQETETLWLVLLNTTIFFPVKKIYLIAAF